MSSRAEADEKKKAVIYCRVSTKEQVQKDALNVQVKEAKRAVQQNAWLLVGQYIELESGTTKEHRPEYLRLLSDMKEDKYDIIVIKSLDRLNRSAKNWYLFVEELMMYDKLLYIYMDQSFYHTDDNLLAGIRAILAEQYSRELSRKINNAHAYRQKTGTAVLLTNNTYGYRKNPDKSVSVHPEEAEMIRKIYRLAAQGYGSYTISNLLYADGIRNRNGNQLGETTIRRIIKNPLYKGTAVMHRKHFDFDKKEEVHYPPSCWIYHPGLVPAIVDDEIWERANGMIKLSFSKYKGSSGKKHSAKAFGLSGKIICGQCGAPYYKTSRWGGKEKKERIVEWKCSTYLKKGRKNRNRREAARKTIRSEEEGCDNISIRQELLSGIIGELSGKLLFCPDEKRLMGKIGKALDAVSFGEEYNYRENRLEKKAENIRKKEKRLLDLLLEEVITPEEYRQKQERLREEEREISRQIENREKQENRLQEEMQKRKKWEIKLTETNFGEIRDRVFLMTVENICVDGEDLSIRLSPSALELLTDSHSEIQMKSLNLLKNPELCVML